MLRAVPVFPSIENIFAEQMSPFPMHESKSGESSYYIGNDVIDIKIST